MVQSDVLTLRVMQDAAFQQAVQAGQVQAAAKAAVSLLAVCPQVHFLLYIGKLL